MSMKSSSAFDTSSREYVEWMSAVWKANDLRNQLEKQLKLCEELALKTKPKEEGCNHSPFNWNINRTYMSECAPGGGVARWVQCSCSKCGKTWEEVGLL